VLHRTVPLRVRARSARAGAGGARSDGKSDGARVSTTCVRYGHAGCLFNVVYRDPCRGDDTIVKTVLHECRVE
jgi:hypothetical protein